MTALAELVDSRELLGSLTAREVRGKYKGSALGYGWSLLNPLAMMLVFTLVFHFVLKLRIQEPAAGGFRSYPLYLLCALLPWNFFSAVISGGMGAMLANANLIKKTYFPREMLVAAVVTSSGVTWGIEMLVLLAAFLVYGSVPLLWLPLVLVYMVSLAAFALGIGLMLSVLNVYFRDTVHLIGIALQLLFYLSPVIYGLEYITEGHSPKVTQAVERYHLLTLYHLNPLADYFQGIREALYFHRFLGLGWTAYGVAVAAVVLVLGHRTFSRFEGRLAEEL